jgi:UDP-N-acetyl-D-galactosamine dehydrogenase
VEAGVYMSPSIQVAEAAKVIENTQRDLNIALVNEFAKIFTKMNLDTTEVLKTAETKWNFLPFKPGLVGGHCIGVDPYYLAYKSNILGYQADLILAGRSVNDSMAQFIVDEICKKFSATKNCKVPKIVTILGLAFKENCTDLRNSKVVDLVNSFKKVGCDTYIHDPLAIDTEVTQVFGSPNCAWEDLPKSDVVVLTVPHNFYLKIGKSEIAKKINRGGLFADVKSVFDPDDFEKEGVEIWRL